MLLPKTNVKKIKEDKMNNVLLVVGIVLTFSALVGAKKLFGESGIIGFMAVATILANIILVKSVTLLGISATLGNVMFASNFLATDILTECYGVKSARKGAIFAICSSIMFLIAIQIALVFTPNEFDFAQESLQTLFGFMPRITLASVALFALSNILDVNLYEHLRKKTGGKYMWLRNNVSTILCNGAENFIFYAIAFGGTYDWGTIASMGLSATIIEIIIALCDTPFLYLAVGERNNGKRAELATK